MKLGYIIMYVNKVSETVAFYQEAFGLRLRFLHESHAYAEMETGETILAFASEIMAQESKLDIRVNNSHKRPAGFEIAFVTKDVEGDFQKALQGGAQKVLEPVKKPWGQVVSYLRDINGCLVELCSSMA